GSDDRHLGDRGVAHALGPELLEHPLRHAHRAAHLGDVLAHDEDVVVPPHGCGHGVANRFPVRKLEHHEYTFFNASSGLGRGPFLGTSTEASTILTISASISSHSESGSSSFSRAF